MSSEKITFEKWQEYLVTLYDWIQDQYDKLSKKEISEEEYKKHLDYYQLELDRINRKVDDAKEKIPTDTRIQQFDKMIIESTSNDVQEVDVKETGSSDEATIQDVEPKKDSFLLKNFVLY